MAPWPVTLLVIAACLAFAASGSRLNGSQRAYLRRSGSPLLAYSAKWSRVGFVLAGLSAIAAAIWALVDLILWVLR